MLQSKYFSLCVFFGSSSVIIICDYLLWIYFVAVSDFLLNNQYFFVSLLNKTIGTYLEGYQFLCQAQIHRRQDCLLKEKKKTDKDVNRGILPLRYYCLKIVNLVIEDFNVHYHINREVLPCLLVKTFCKFPATS